MSGPVIFAQPGDILDVAIEAAEKSASSPARPAYNGDFRQRAIPL
jgi:hypothetical protein